MFDFNRMFDLRSSLLPMLLLLFMAGCGGGGQDPILGTPGASALPMVTATTPVASAPVVTGVALTSAVSAVFSKDMASDTLNASSFTLNCPAGTPVRATVSYNPATRVVTLTPEAALRPATLCVATLTTAVKDTMGLALASNFVWGFLTAPAPDLTAPTVVMTVPASGAVGVLTNTPVTAVFSEDMRAASINSTSFTLVNNTRGTAVPGTVSYSATGRSAVFTPSAPEMLAPGSSFTATITTAATDLAGNALAANFVWTFTTAALPDTTRPTVVMTVPQASATGVANNTAITATFSENMNPASLSTTSFTLVNTTLGTAVPGTVSYSATSRSAVFTPSNPALLSANSAYTATITTAATDLAGNAMASSFTWSFNTAAAGDTTRPTVITAVPAPNASAVPSNTAISVSFSEDMLPASLSTSSLTVVNNSTGMAVAGLVTYAASGRTAVFTPSTPATLAANTSFTATLTTAATDLAGNALAANFVWTFTTAGAADTTRPTVIATVPSANASGVPNNTAISASFSEDMNPNSITAGSFTVLNTTLGTVVPGTVSYSATGRSAIFTPSNPTTLAGNNSFRATVTSAVTDLAGNALAADVVWTFGTVATPDASAPRVIATVPALFATAVPTNSAVSATFSEDMNPASLSTTSFTLFNNTLGTPVAGTVSYSVTGRTAVFTPSTPATFAGDTRYTATVTTGATDLAGNATGGNFIWTFTTAGLGDTTRPTILVSVPLANDSNVATNSRLTATFSEAMNPTTISSAVFTLINSSTGIAVAGNVSYSVAARTATFTPANGAVLASNADFTARITTAATDLAGNALAGNTALAPNAGDHVWSFSTAVLGDAVPPVITVLSPLSGSTEVCTSTAVSATFSEPMDPNTVDDNSLVVTDNGVAVAGSVSYNAQSRMVSFVAGAPAGFAASRSFVATVRSGSTGARDLAGNALAADRSWTFTTGTQACPLP